MKKYLSFLLIFFFLSGCHHNKSVIADPTGDGSSMDNAVVILEKKSERALYSEECAWLAVKYPGYTQVSVGVADKNSNTYNVIKIKTTDGKIFDVYFDVSIFYNNQ